MTKEKFDITYLLLSAQRALFDKVIPSLRAVTIEFNEEKNLLDTRFFFDSPVTDELIDLASCAITEIDINLPIFYEHNADYAIQWEYPRPIPLTGRLIYLRKEPIKTHYNQEKVVRYFDKSLRLMARLLLVMQEVLLGKVAPNLREISTSAEEKSQTIELFFHFNGLITKEDSDLAHQIVEETKIYFPKFMFESHIERADFPEKIKVHGESTVYARKED